MNPEAVLEAEGWGNRIIEAYTGNRIGHRAVRTRLKVDQNSVFDLKRGNVWSKLDSLKREPG